MTTQEYEYRRLPGRGRKRGGFITITRIRAALYTGRDHLLSVFSTGYTEEYKRFYYRDIQAIVMRKTGRGTVWSIASALFFLLFAALAATATATPLVVVFWVSAGLASLILLVNLLLGPTCICQLQTAVSREELPSLGREKAAKKAVDLLRPLIEAAQGRLSREEIAAGWEKLSPHASAVASRSGKHAGRSVSSYRGKVHEALFYLLLLDGILSGANIFMHGPALGITGSLLWVAISVTVIVALTRQQGGLTRGLRSITWAAFGYMVGTLGLGYVLGLSVAVRNPEAMAAIGNSQWELFKMFSSLSPAENPVLMAATVFSVAFATPLGISGLVLLRKFRLQLNPAPAIQPLPGERSALSGSTEQ